MQKSIITTELALVKGGLGGCRPQQAMCFLAKNALLAAMIVRTLSGLLS